nr:acyl carrier protein [uncultured Bacteroides sp.]
MNIEEKVKEIVSKICEIDTIEVNDDSSIGKYPQWDSVGHLAILSEVEEAFNINFEAEEMMEIEKVDDIIVMVKKILKINQ